VDACRGSFFGDHIRLGRQEPPRVLDARSRVPIRRPAAPYLRLKGRVPLLPELRAAVARPRGGDGRPVPADTRLQLPHRERPRQGAAGPQSDCLRPDMQHARRRHRKTPVVSWYRVPADDADVSGDFVRVPRLHRAEHRAADRQAVLETPHQRDVPQREGDQQLPRLRQPLHQLFSLLRRRTAFSARTRRHVLPLPSPCRRRPETLGP